MKTETDYTKTLIRCAAPAVNAVEDREAMRISAVISNQDLNRNGQRVMQAGWDFADYMKNPIVLFGHDDNAPAIGKNVTLGLEGERLRAVTEFAPTAFGREMFTLYAGGYMRAWSPGFLPTEVSFKKNDQGDIEEVIFNRMKLLEYSAVAIPANADAVSEALDHGLIGRETHALVMHCSQSLDRTSSQDADGLLDGLTGTLDGLTNAGLSLRVAGIRQSLGLHRRRHDERGGAT